MEATKELPTPDQAPGTQSSDIGKLASALVKAQAAIKAAKKDAKNPHFGSRYSTLAEVWDVIREPLTSNGLAVMQLTQPTDGLAVRVTTMLAHESGQFIRAEISMPLRPEFTKAGQQLPPGPQQVGSAITYARRYGLCAMVGVASADDDDDANASHAEPPPEDHKPITPELKARAEQMRADGRMKPLASAKPAAQAGERSPGQAAEQPAAQPEQPAGATPAPAKAQDATAFNARLYEACKAAGITLDDLQDDLRAKGILKGQMTVDNLGEPIVNALLTGKDRTSGRPNWDIVVERIKARKM